MELSSLEIPPFCISLNYKGKVHHLTVTQVRLDISIEVFEVSGIHTAKQIQSLRPYYRMHDGATQKYQMTVYPGTHVTDKQALEMVIAELRKVISWFEKDG